VSLEIQIYEMPSLELFLITVKESFHASYHFIKAGQSCPATLLM